MIKIKNKIKSLSVFLAVILCIICFADLTVWSNELANDSMNDPVLFIKEGGLPEATSEEVKDIIDKRAISLQENQRLLRSAGVTFENYLVEKLKLQTVQIDISNYEILTSKVYDAFSAVLNNHPELYYVDTYLKWTYNPSTNVVTGLTITYRDYDKVAINAETDKVLALIDESMTDLEKVIVIHDYLCINVEYAYEDYLAGTVSNDAHSLKGALLDKTAVCDGYASAFQYFMSLLNIPCNFISGTSEGVGHAWNQVCLNGKWYLVDVTWDDPTWDNYGHTGHDYFLKSADDFENHSWKVSDYETCNSQIYNLAFWSDVNTQLIWNKGEWYYINSEGNLYKHNFSTDSLTDAGTFIKSLGSKWFVFGSTSSYYIENYSKIAMKNGFLYYSQPSGIYKCNFDGSKAEQLIEADTTNGYVYGMMVRGNTLYYQISQKPYIKQRNIFENSLEKLSQSISVSNSNIKKTFGDEIFNLNASAVAGKLTYTSMNTNIVKVDDKGNVTITGAGSTSITVKTPGSAQYKSASKTVQITVSQKKLPNTVQLSGTSYAYSGTQKKPKVTISGLISGTDFIVSYQNNIHTGTALAVVTGKGNYTGTYTKTFKIYSASQSISVSSANIKKSYGDSTFSLGAKASGGGKLSYLSANSNVALISNTGTVTIKGLGSTTITIKAAATQNHKAISRTIKITVDKKTIKGTIKIGSSQYVYNGKAKKPTVKIGNLIQNKDFKVSFSNNINIGKAKITVTGIGNYKGVLTKTFSIVPAKVSISTLKHSGAGSMQVKWKKQSCGGYEIVYSKKSNFNSTNKRITVSGSTRISKTVVGLTSGQKYYVKIRAYKVVNGQKLYGAYSQKLSMTVR